MYMCPRGQGEEADAHTSGQATEETTRRGAAETFTGCARSESLPRWGEDGAKPLSKLNQDRYWSELCMHCWHCPCCPYSSNTWRVVDKNQSITQEVWNTWHHIIKEESGLWQGITICRTYDYRSRHKAWSSQVGSNQKIPHTQRLDSIAVSWDWQIN